MQPRVLMGVVNKHKLRFRCECVASRAEYCRNSCLLSLGGACTTRQQVWVQPRVLMGIVSKHKLRFRCECVASRAEYCRNSCLLSLGGACTTTQQV